MALLFIDGFDHYATADILKKWTVVNSAVWISNVGRRAGSGLYVNNNTAYIYKAISPSSATAIVGGAFNISSAGAVPLFIGGGPLNYTHIFLEMAANGAINVYRQGNGLAPYTPQATLLGTTEADVVGFSSWSYIELKVYVHDSNGTVDVRVNGVSKLSLSSQDTAYNGTTISIAGCGYGAYYYVDDFYICDTSGSTNNDFLGDVCVDAHYPTAEGATHDWTPSTGANNAALIDETAPNTTDYNSTSTLNAVDTFMIEDLKNTGSNLLGVQLNLCHSKEDAGDCLIAPVSRPVSTDIPGTDVAPSLSSYVYNTTMYEVNPGNSAPWTESAFNATEFGYKKTG